MLDTDDTASEFEKINEDTKIFMNLRRLRDIKRCNNFPSLNSEDVAQHSYYATMLALILAKEHEYYVASHDQSEFAQVDVNEVMMKAICHDLEEAFIGDIPKNIKDDPDVKKEVMKATKKKMDEIYSRAATTRSLKQYNEDCKKNLEGQFVDVADLLELGIYCWEEISLGNSAMKSLLQKCIGLIYQMPISLVLKKTSDFFNSTMRMLNSKVLVENASVLYNID